MPIGVEPVVISSSMISTVKVAHPVTVGLATATMVADPSVWAVARPVELTEATSEAELFQDTD
jgi:hypothetical protein